MLNYFDVIKAQSGIPVDDIWAHLWGNTMSTEYVITTYTGTLPAILTGTKAGYLERYKIYGNTEQTGTPTPENPIMLIGCGERVDITGLNEPLCGIGTYTDSLNLSTGTLTRRIKKLVLTGEENWTSNNGEFFFTNVNSLDFRTTVFGLLCSHLPVILRDAFNRQPSAFWGRAKIGDVCLCTSDTIMSLSNFQSYLASQYAAGTPVTLWYVLAEPETSTISVPTGLTGTIDGYLIQDGTPALETPIYPTANGVKQADDTYSIQYGYKLPILSNSTITDIYIGDTQLAKDEYVDSETGKIYRYVDGTLTPTDPPVPFPQIPTTANSTTISWAGEGLAPSEVELKYKTRKGDET